MYTNLQEVKYKQNTNVLSCTSKSIWIVRSECLSLFGSQGRGCGTVVSICIIGDGVDTNTVTDGGGDVVCGVVATVMTLIVRQSYIHETIFVVFG
jgi:hypothetical protein